MAPKAEMVKRIKSLQGRMNQVEFARYLGVPQSRVSEWGAGKRPTAEMCVRLGKLAPYPDNLWFLDQAGLKQDDILSVARHIMKERNAPAAPGEIVRIPRFRQTLEGREPAGPPVALSAQFIRHPLATICLLVDDKSTGIVSAPHGATFLDTSFEGAYDLSALWDRVVMIDYRLGDPSRVSEYGAREHGLYVGRMRLMPPNWAQYQPGVSRFLGMSELLLKEPIGSGSMINYLHVGTYKVSVPESELSAENKEQIESRASGELRLFTGVRVLGKVIGRLTGHLETDTA